MAARFPEPAFDITALERYDPPLPPAVERVCLALFALLLGATALLLWRAHLLSGGAVFLAGAAIVGGLYVVGWLSEGGRRVVRAKSLA